MRLGPLFADIMIVDEDPDFVRPVRRVLQAAGYTVRTASSGEAAIEAVQARPPDLILLDTTLPGMDGYELVRRLRAEASLPFIPIIMVTAENGQGSLAAALNAGADDFIYHREDNVELLTRVRAMLRLKSTTDALAELNATLEQKVVERTRELEEAHARLHHAEKLSSLGRMAASIAHEINNPLTGLLSYVHLIKRALPDDSEILPDVLLVEQQVNAIAGLVRQLRDFSKPPRKERRLVILNTALEDVLALMHSELLKHRIEVVRAFDAALPPILASAEQMREVLLNIILNAQDAMPEGGTLTVRTSADDTWVQAQVTDTGTGIAPEIMERIFEPFFTTKGEHGTGLGLAICHSIIQDHGGDILVESREGQGTTFTVQLPRA